jgi:hypothetical protein
MTPKKKAPARKVRAKKGTVKPGMAPLLAAGSPENYRVRVRMYRQGLGDCFLLTFPRSGKKPFQILIDCGALDRNAQWMTQVVEHIRDTVRDGEQDKAHLDLVVATHEHKDHLSGFNQARKVFENDFSLGGVWLGWTENLTQPEIKKIKETKKAVSKVLRAALNSHMAKVRSKPLDGVAAFLAFSEDDDTASPETNEDGQMPRRNNCRGSEYSRRGRKAGNVQYLSRAQAPSTRGVDDVSVMC